MHLPSKSLRSVALFIPLSEAKPRSAGRSTGLSWFVVPENGRASCRDFCPISMSEEDDGVGLGSGGAGILPVRERRARCPPHLSIAIVGHRFGKLPQQVTVVVHP